MQYLPATASWQLMTAGFHDGFATAHRLAARLVCRDVRSA